ncbi:cold shock domain-containing protein [Pseudonocardia sp. MCCB 268]|nr:cold shock domain-containing protein [Pseudonocardia cytotoxica]
MNEGSRTAEGTVKWFNSEAGYGFLPRRWWCGRVRALLAIQTQGVQDLDEGQRVSFDIEQGLHSRRPARSPHWPTPSTSVCGPGRAGPGTGPAAPARVCCPSAPCISQTRDLRLRPRCGDAAAANVDDPGGIACAPARWDRSSLGRSWATNACIVRRRGQLRDPTRPQPHDGERRAFPTQRAHPHARCRASPDASTTGSPTSTGASRRRTRIPAGASGTTQYLHEPDALLGCRVLGVPHARARARR